MLRYAGMGMYEVAAECCGARAPLGNGKAAAERNAKEKGFVQATNTPDAHVCPKCAEEQKQHMEQFK